MALYKNKNLIILIGGQLVSQIGDKLYMLALAYMVLEKTKSPGMMGVVLFCSLFPATVLGAVAGVFIDRHNKKWFIVGADLIRGSIVALVAVAYYYNVLDLQWIILVQILISICSAFFDPAIPAIIPLIVEKKQLAKANSMTQFIQGFSSIIGPALAGIAVIAYGYLFILIFNALSYLISGVVECFLSIGPQISKTIAYSSIKEDLVAGFQYIKVDGKLLMILYVVAIIHFFVGSLEVIFPVIAMELEGNGVENLGYLKMGFGIGMVAMAFGTGIYGLKNKEEGSLFSSLICIGFIFIIISIALFSQVLTLPVYLSLFTIFGASILIASISFRTLLQKNVEDEMMGRVFGLVSSIGNISIPIATLVYGVLFSYLEYKYLLIGSGILLIIISSIAFKKLQRPIPLPVRI
ncbi:MAG: MFS transporter [Proteobacteria bacterium]|nr:MFS transporter [Pseudomonadota bacterium]